MVKPQIQYPCLWSYKVIGADPDLVKENIEIVLKHYEVAYHEAKQSRTGKYTSFHLSVQVQDEAERNTIFDKLKNIPTVKVVL